MITSCGVLHFYSGTIMMVYVYIVSPNLQDMVTACLFEILRWNAQYSQIMAIKFNFIEKITA